MPLGRTCVLARGLERCTHVVVDLIPLEQSLKEHGTYHCWTERDIETKRITAQAICVMASTTQHDVVCV